VNEAEGGEKTLGLRLFQRAEHSVGFLCDAVGYGVAGGIAFVQEGEVLGEFFDAFQGGCQRDVM
jgi:hypothetical protein